MDEPAMVEPAMVIENPGHITAWNALQPLLHVLEHSMTIVQRSRLVAAAGALHELELEAHHAALKEKAG